MHSKPTRCLPADCGLIPKSLHGLLVKAFPGGNLESLQGFQHRSGPETTVSYVLPMPHAHLRLLGETTLVELASSPAPQSRGTRPATPRHASHVPAQTPLLPKGAWPTGSPRVMEKGAFPSPVSWRPPSLKACRRLRTGRDRSSGTGS